MAPLFGRGRCYNPALLSLSCLSMSIRVRKLLMNCSYSMKFVSARSISSSNGTPMARECSTSAA